MAYVTLVAEKIKYFVIIQLWQLQVVNELECRFISVTPHTVPQVILSPFIFLLAVSTGHISSQLTPLVNRR